MNIEHSVVLADTNRIRQFFEICEHRNFFTDVQNIRDERGLPWSVVIRGDYAVGVPLIGPGRWFTEASREHWRDQYEQRLLEIMRQTPDEQLSTLVAIVNSLRLGALASRLIWIIQSELMRQKQSILRLPATFLRDGVWASNFPTHWRSNLRELLESLSAIHICDDVDSIADTKFRDATSLITHFKIPVRGESVKCFEGCRSAGESEHEHVLINTGLGFAGILERMADGNKHESVRTYHFPNPMDGKSQLKVNEEKLKKIGKTGRLTSVFLPALLGQPDQINLLTRSQRRLFQVMFRERTLESKKSKQAIAATEMIAGNLVNPVGPKRKGKPFRPLACPLLLPTGQYVGFNGNGVRKGRGYKVSTWAERGSYPTAQDLVSDFKALADHLNLIVVCVDPRTSEWTSLRDLEARVESQPWATKSLHLRVYADSNYEQNWKSFFGWLNEQNASSQSNANEVMGILNQYPYSRSYWASALEIDPSAFSKMLRGKRNLPDDLVERLRSLIESR